MRHSEGALATVGISWSARFGGDCHEPCGSRNDEERGNVVRASLCCLSRLFVSFLPVVRASPCCLFVSSSLLSLLTAPSLLSALLPVVSLVPASLLSLLTALLPFVRASLCCLCVSASLLSLLTALLPVVRAPPCCLFVSSSLFSLLTAPLSFVRASPRSEPPHSSEVVLWVEPSEDTHPTLSHSALSLQQSSLIVEDNLFEHGILALGVVVQLKIITKQARNALIERCRKARTEIFNYVEHRVVSLSIDKL